MPVEEFENLYRNLAAIVEAIAYLCRRKIAVRRFGGYRCHDLHNLCNGIAQEEMIVDNLVDLSYAPDQLENPFYFRFGDTRVDCDIAHARRPETILAAEIL